MSILMIGTIRPSNQLGVYTLSVSEVAPPKMSKKEARQTRVGPLFNLFNQEDLQRLKQGYFQITWYGRLSLKHHQDA